MGRLIILELIGPVSMHLSGGRRRRRGAVELRDLISVISIVSNVDVPIAWSTWAVVK